jgi:hypothetical protein
VEPAFGDKKERRRSFGYGQVKEETAGTKEERKAGEEAVEQQCAMSGNGEGRAGCWWSAMAGEREEG